MIVLLSIIIVLLLLIFGTLIYFLFRILLNKPLEPSVEPSTSIINEILQIMKDNRDEKERIKIDKELYEYSQKNLSKRMPLSILSTQDRSDNSVISRNGELVPFNLTYQEKEILEMFNS